MKDAARDEPPQAPLDEEPFDTRPISPPYAPRDFSPPTGILCRRCWHIRNGAGPDRCVCARARELVIVHAGQRVTIPPPFEVARIEAHRARRGRS
jgi:hypothetical protein